MESPLLTLSVNGSVRKGTCRASVASPIDQALLPHCIFGETAGAIKDLISVSRSPPANAAHSPTETPAAAQFAANVMHYTFRKFLNSRTRKNA